MESLSKLSISTICYVTEKLELVKKSMLNILSEEDRGLKLSEYNSMSSFGDKITILNLEIENKYLQRCLEHLSSSLTPSDKAFLTRHFAKRLDFDEKSFYFRLDKFKLLEEKMELAEGSDVVKVVISYSTFTNSQNTEDNIRKLFIQSGIITE